MTTEQPRIDTRDRRIGYLLVALAILWIFAGNGFSSTSFNVFTGVMISAGIYAIAALGLNVHFGFTGLLNFGHVAFMGVGAYTVVLLVPHGVGRLGETGGSWPLIPAILAGMALAALLGLLLGIPTLRLRGDYLAIVTIAVGEILRLVARAAEGVTGGVFGVINFSNSLQNLRPAFISDIARELRVPPAQFFILLTTWILVLAVWFGLRLVLRSPWGRVLKSIREDEEAARALGKNIVAYKRQSLMIGGAIGGLAGAMLALSFGAVRPDTFLPLITFFVWAILLIGGAGSLAGPIAGSVIFWAILSQTDSLAGDLFGGSAGGAAVAGFRFVLAGALIMAIMIVRPQGLFGKKEELLLEIK